MRKLTLVIVAMLVLSSLVMAQWKWISIDGVSKKPTPIQVKLLNATPKEVKLEINVPGYLERKVKLPDGTEVVMIHIPETARTMERGFPMLPLFAKAIKLHEQRCEPELKVLEKKEVEFKLALPVIPSKGHFTRDISEESVPFEFGPIYKQDVFWPAEKEQFQLGKSFLLRDIRGAVLRMLPIRANHVAMQLKIVAKAVVVVVCDGGEELMTVHNTQAPSRTFQNLTSDFVGYEEQVLRGEVPAENVKKLVVVTPSQFKDAIGEWVAWKQKCGYAVTIKEVSSGVKAADIKSYLQSLYDNVATRFGYVVLIGDAGYSSDFVSSQPMPTFKGVYEGAAADRVYVRLAGSDNYPDAFISRISALTATNVREQLAKVIAYEQGVGAGDWILKGVSIASNEGSPADYTRADWLINGGGTGQKVPVLAGGLKGVGYTHDRIYAPSATASAVTTAVNDGRGIICYIGHGSSTSWVTTGFNVANAQALNNGLKLPVIWSVACVNADFVRQETCFAEAWLRNSKGGAVAMEAASTNESWVPPCDKQAATINAVISKKYSTFGALECEGLVAGLKNWGDTDKTEGNKMAEQCHLFGDCSMLVRTQKPALVQVANERGLDNNIVFTVTSEDRAIIDATVTVYNADLSVVATADTLENGQASVVLPSEANDAELFYTIVGQDIIAVVDQPVK